MWSRLSLRFQIVAVLALLLGAEALAGSVWMLMVLPRTYVAAERQHDQALAQVIGERCAAAPSAACAQSAIEAPPVDHRDEWRRAVGLFQFQVANVGAVAVGLLILGVVLFNRIVARPVDELAAAADRIGHLELHELGAALDRPMLGQLTRSFERMARALQGEQARVTGQIAELTRINAELQEARDAIVRQEKLATVGRLAAGVAHEVGNPLGGILGYAGLLKAKGEPLARDYAERIEREVGRIDRTVRGLLDFSRPSAATLSPVALPACVDRVLALCRADSRFRQVETEIDLSPELPAVMADEHQLGQVLVNLLLNAGDAMGGAGRVSITAEVRDDDANPHRRASDPQPGARVTLCIDDSGPGIPPDTLPRIFDPFFTTKDVGQGTGLGLSISSSLVEAFGGALVAENLPQGGARFRVVLRAATD